MKPCETGKEEAAVETDHLGGLGSHIYLLICSVIPREVRLCNPHVLGCDSFIG